MDFYLNYWDLNENFAQIRFADYSLLSELLGFKPEVQGKVLVKSSTLLSELLGFKQREVAAVFLVARRLLSELLGFKHLQNKTKEKLIPSFI